MLEIIIITINVYIKILRIEWFKGCIGGKQKRILYIQATGQYVMFCTGPYKFWLFTNWGHFPLKILEKIKYDSSTIQFSI